MSLGLWVVVEYWPETIGRRSAGVFLPVDGSLAKWVSLPHGTPCVLLSPFDGYLPMVTTVGDLAATAPPTLLIPAKSPCSTLILLPVLTVALSARVRLGPVTSLPPKMNLATFPTSFLNQGSIHGTCPVGSTRFTGSPTQYIYAFNPPPRNGLQLSGL
ncbi:hypothetical protein D3C75_933900 [compost metagenome]